MAAANKCKDCQHYDMRPEVKHSVGYPCNRPNHEWIRDVSRLKSPSNSACKGFVPKIKSAEELAAGVANAVLDEIDTTRRWNDDNYLRGYLDGLSRAMQIVKAEIDRMKKGAEEADAEKLQSDS